MREKKRKKYKILAIAILFLFGTISSSGLKEIVSATSCPSLRVVFARGSGGELNNDQNYLAYKTSIETKLLTTSLDYEFIDLDYPAVGIGIDNLDVALGALFGRGEAYEFGDSVKAGVKKLDNLVNSSSCPDTKYVIGGYSQGAMVISKALNDLNPERIIYAATFGDPKIYLPEGQSFLSIPPACRYEQLSNYRMYVPDCYAYEGLLGSYKPYQPEALIDKLGTWCNKADLFCSSKFNVSDHVSYVSDDLYEDASKVIFAKIAEHFDIENTISSMHDTAILIDNTSSMEVLISRYKREALRLARKTFATGGRVALYTFGDVAENALPIELCNFETCTSSSFKYHLETISPSGGGDPKESLLSGSFNTMRSLNWRHGSTKSLVILTDSGFHSPDLDGVTVMDVISLSRKIDPVYIYVVSREGTREIYTEFTASTGGRFVSIDEELSLFTDEVMERFDSLPRVEEETEPREIPTLSIKSYRAENDGASISFKTNADKVMVVLNDYVLGFTEEDSIKLSGIDYSVKNIVRLIPYSESIRGEGVELKIYEGDKLIPSLEVESSSSITTPVAPLIMPSAPATGKR